MQRSKTTQVIGVFFVFLGLLFSAIGGTSLLSTFNFFERAVSNPGRVTGFQQGAPIVRYEYQGVTSELIGGVQTNPPVYQLGESVTVMLNPSFPSEARLDGWLENYFFASIFGGLGGVFLIVALAFLFIPKETQRPDST